MDQRVLENFYVPTCIATIMLACSLPRGAKRRRVALLYCNNSIEHDDLNIFLIFLIGLKKKGTLPTTETTKHNNPIIFIFFIGLKKRKEHRTMENIMYNRFGSAVDYQFLVALFCRPDFFDRKLSLTLDSSCCAD